MLLMDVIIYERKFSEDDNILAEQRDWRGLRREKR